MKDRGREGGDPLNVQIEPWLMGLFPTYRVNKHRERSDVRQHTADEDEEGGGNCGSRREMRSQLINVCLIKNVNLFRWLTTATER